MPDQGPQAMPLRNFGQDGREQEHPGQSTPVAKLRGATLAMVAELATDQFAERIRLDAARRVIVMVRSVSVLQDLQDLGQMQAPPQGWLSQLAKAWDPHAMTAREFAELLPPGDVDRIVSEATAWARAVRPNPAAANGDEPIARATMA